MRVRNLEGVIRWRLCIGCGACVFACPENKIEMFDFENDGLRPKLDLRDCNNYNACFIICPGHAYPFRNLNNQSNLSRSIWKYWGPVYEVWEGYAVDPVIRMKGSSAGVVSALAAYCLEREGMGGVIQTGADVVKPWKNVTVFSTTREELVSRTGSRYGPASPCEELNRIVESSGACVFIGKPCDVAGLRKTQILRPGLKQKVGLAIGIFCAGTPSTKGTLDLLQKLKVRPEAVNGIRYRGEGWPGNFTIKMKRTNLTRELSYNESWGHLQRYRPFRCYLCPDGTSEFADISCGDAWHCEISKNEMGRSLVLVRTERGREILRQAKEKGYLHLNTVDLNVLEKAQRTLLLKRRAI